jgi:NADH-quinone oxidoreductase subunit A
MMNALIFSLFLYLATAIALALLIIFIIYFVNLPVGSTDKTIAYECGFKPFDFNYYSFDVQFYRIGILFLLFDVEIIFFFPWFLNLYHISWIGQIFSFVFVVILSAGFIYELKVGALAWYPKPWLTFAR